MSLRLIASGIEKSYNGERILRGCSFSFTRSGVYVLTGANGGGKSTFLRICSLLEEPERGEVSYFSGDSVLAKDASLRRRITLVLPRVGVFNTSVFNNAAYGLKIRNAKKREREEKVAAALELVGLLHKKEQNALTLSSGEAQRLGIARAWVIGPEVLFLDEPTASVDLKNTAMIEEIIMTLKGEGNSVIVVATHDREQAQRLGGRGLVMENGVITPA